MVDEESGQKKGKDDTPAKVGPQVNRQEPRNEEGPKSKERGQSNQRDT
jgi:hypothetical protein